MPMIDTNETKTTLPDPAPPAPAVLEGEVVEENALVVVPEPTQVALSTVDPTEFLERAVKQADALKRIIDRKNLSVAIGGSRKPHVLIGGWQTLMALNGVMPHTVGIERSTCMVEMCPFTKCVGGRLTTRVTVELRRVSDQAVLTRVESECSQHERRWAGADHYAVTSMAQTRGVGKACRQLFGWVMELAGYDATPAEEMPETRPDAPEASTSETSKPAPVPMSVETVALLKARIKELNAAAKGGSTAAAAKWGEFTEWMKKVGSYDDLFDNESYTYAAKRYLGIDQPPPKEAKKAQSVGTDAATEPDPTRGGGDVTTPAWSAEDQQLVRETYRSILGFKKEGHERAAAVLTKFAAFMNENNLDWTGTRGRVSLWTRPDLRDQVFTVLELGDVPAAKPLPFDPDEVPE